MTANAMAGDREACIKAGMDDFISKPIIASELQAKVAHWLPMPYRKNRRLRTMGTPQGTASRHSSTHLTASPDHSGSASSAASFHPAATMPMPAISRLTKSTRPLGYPLNKEGPYTRESSVSIPYFDPTVYWSIASSSFFETLIFGSRWIQAPLYGGLIVAELLYAAKFLTELWHMVVHFREETETLFMLGVLSLIDVTMVANLLTMVIIGGYATFVNKLDPGHPPGSSRMADPRGPRHHQDQARRVTRRNLQHSSPQGLCGRHERKSRTHQVENFHSPDLPWVRPSSWPIPTN